MLVIFAFERGELSICNFDCRTHAGGILALGKSEVLFRLFHQLGCRHFSFFRFFETQVRLFDFKKHRLGLRVE